MDLLSAVASVPYAGPFLPYIPVLIAIAAVATRFMAPPTESSGFYAATYSIANWVAQNGGHATNLTAPNAVQPTPGPSAAGSLGVAILLGLSLTACNAQQTADLIAAAPQTFACLVTTGGAIKGIADTSEPNATKALRSATTAETAITTNPDCQAAGTAAAKAIKDKTPAIIVPVVAVPAGP
jgi:hypothetical protein